MQANNVDILIDEADKMLEAASNELQRSQEDVISHLICYNSRQSIVNYLSSFLINNNIELLKPVSMAGLLDQCRAVDSRFDMINISEIGCSHDQDDGAYCLNLEKVSDCLKTAMQTRDMVTSEAPPY